MKFLEAVNLVLRSGGKAAVNSLSDPNEDKGFAMAELVRQRKQVLTNGYIFNTTFEILLPDGDQGGFVPVPVNEVLHITYPDSKRYTERQGPAPNLTQLVFDHGDERTPGSFVTSKVNAIVVRDLTNIEEEDLDFDKIQEKCALWIAKRAASEFYFQINQQGSDVLKAEAEKSKTLFINAQPKRNLNRTTRFWQLLATQAGGQGTFDARTQTNVF